MTRGTVLGTVLPIVAMNLAAAPILTTRDYDNFYSEVVLKAKNGNKAEWLASYEPIVQFIAKVRQDVEKLPRSTQTELARAVHDNGYWKGQKARIADPLDPFLGARFKADDATLKRVLTAEGYKLYHNRYSRASGSHRLSLEAVADRAALFKIEGKNIPRPASIPADTNIINANAQSWNDLLIDAKLYENPAERLRVIINNQLNGIASSLALLRGSKPLSDAEMDYAVAVIWRYTGHYSGKDAWERESLVRKSYSELSEAEKAKDRDVWKALREALKTHRIR